MGAAEAAAIPVALVQTAGLVLIRIASIFMIAPAFSQRQLPVMVRAALALLFTIVLLFAVPMLPRPLSAPCLALSICMQVALGFLQGFVFAAVLAAAVAAGDLLDLTMGFAFSAMVDPGVDTGPHAICSRLFQTVSTLLFLALGGHIWVLGALVRSLQVIPLSATTLPHNLMEVAVTQSAHVLMLGLQMATPIVAFMVLFDVVAMLVARALPQMHIMAVGFPFKIILGLLGCLWFLPQVFGALVRSLQTFYTLVTGGP